MAWNWHPAKVFLGDVGSVPLGFLLGWLLLELAARGFWTAALILPLYYLADATWTLIARASRGEKIWRAHREHFYQVAVGNGKSHAEVSLALMACNLGLIVLAAGSVMPDPLFWKLAIGLAVFDVGILMLRFRGKLVEPAS